MKTKELIRLLQEVDPSGELECCVDNADIFTVYQEPAYWDGKLQVLIRNEKRKPYYDIDGVKITCKGFKVTIRTLDAEDVVFDDWNCKVEIDCGNMLNHGLDKLVAQWREEGYKFGIEYDKFPCETCVRKPIDFMNIDKLCFDCQPVNKFQNYESK